MKSYTDISQSKKLAEILPIESADMCYRYYSGGVITGYGDCVLAKSFITGKNVIRENDLPCWSLTALLSVLPLPSLIQDKADDELFWQCSVYDEDGTSLCEIYDNNAIDACVAMIEKLHELKLL